MVQVQVSHSVGQAVHLVKVEGEIIFAEGSGAVQAMGQLLLGRMARPQCPWASDTMVPVVEITMIEPRWQIL